VGRELLPQQIQVRRFAAETVPVLCEDRRYSPGGHEIPHAVHTWPLQACTALSGVRYFLEDFVPFSGSVVSQGFYLLCEAIARAGLLVGGDAGVEGGPLGAVAVRVRHSLPLD
jgi:hypothetical protein